jgi:inner membrane transporter RhtA
LLLERLPPSFLLLLAVISIQLGSALAVTLFPVYGALGMLFLRMAAGSLTLLVCYPSSVVRMLRQAPIGIFLLGLTMAVQSGLYYEALARIPLGITVSIEFLGPLGLALATSRRVVDIACVLMAAAGIALLTPSIGTSLDPFGVLLAFAAGAGWAWYIVLIRRLGRQVEGGPGMALAMIISALLLLPYPGFHALADLAAHPATIPAIIGVAMLSAAFPLLFEFIALKSMPARRYGVLVALEPVAATIVGVAFLQATPDLNAWLAVLLISTASVGVALLGRQQPAASADAGL